jgi:hypothetical protein
MPERSSIYALTGDDVVRFTLQGTIAHEPESLLSGVRARCLAINSHDPGRV